MWALTKENSSSGWRLATSQSACNDPLGISTEERDREIKRFKDMLASSYAVIVDGYLIMDFNSIN